MRIDDIPNIQMPLHTLSGKNYLRITLLFFLFFVALFSVYSYQYVGFVMLSLLVVCIVGMVCIRFPKLYLFKDSFEIVEKCLINRFTDRDIFHYNEVKKIEFSKGFTDWSHLIVLTIFRATGYEGNSKPDQMIITTIDDNVFCFNRFGSKKEFIRTIELIQKEISLQEEVDYKQP